MAVDDFAQVQAQRQRNAKSILTPIDKDKILEDEDVGFEPPEVAPTPVSAPKRQGLRGNLADSVAKQTVIEQPEITAPGETRGPKRI